MADKGADKRVERPCPCTDPNLPQFAWASRTYTIACRGKRLLLYTTLSKILDVSSAPLSHDSVLKVLHIDKGILTGEECSTCASKRQDWYKLAAIVIAAKTTDDDRRALDAVRQQSSRDEYDLKEFAGLLRGKPTLITAVATLQGIHMIPMYLVLVLTWSLVKVAHSNPASHHLT